MAGTDFVTEAQIDSLTTTIATNVKANATALATHEHAAADIPIVDSADDYTATNVEAALAEVKVIADAAAGGGVAINDAATNTTNAWSSQKITDEIAVSVSGLIDSAPGALDTLDELAEALGDDPDFATTMATALALRVRVDASQGFTGPQQAQGRANIGVVSSSVDFAGNFTTAVA